MSPNQQEEYQTKSVQSLPVNVPIPKRTTRIKYQVSGFDKNKTEFLLSDDGFIFKLVRSERELEFYREVFHPDCCDEVRLALKQFLPTFYGTWTAQEYSDLFIKLEDVTSKFSSPCIMDVKIGNSHATAKKLAKWRNKCPTLDDVHFMVSEFKTCNLGFGRNAEVKHGPKYFRSLDKEELLTKGIAAFFPSGELFRPALVQAFIRRLKNIESWFLKQSSWQFFGCSILFVYDADAVCSSLNVRNNSSSLIPQNCSARCCSNGETKDSVEEKRLESHVDVRMIDFEHIYPLPSDQSMDTNYLSGLRSLITYLSRLTATTYDSRSI